MITNYYAMKREKSAIRHQYKERRIYPLIELATNVASAYQRYDVVLKEDEESLRLIRELEDIESTQVWKVLVQATGIDLRIDKGFLDLWQQVIELVKLRAEAFAKKGVEFDAINKRFEEARTILEGMEKTSRGESYQELLAKYNEKMNEIDILQDNIDSTALLKLYKDKEFSKRYRSRSFAAAAAALKLIAICYTILEEA